MRIMFAVLLTSLIFSTAVFAQTWKPITSNTGGANTWKQLNSANGGMTWKPLGYGRLANSSDLSCSMSGLSGEFSLSTSSDGYIGTFGCGSQWYIPITPNIGRLYWAMWSIGSLSRCGVVGLTNTIFSLASNNQLKFVPHTSDAMCIVTVALNIYADPDGKKLLLTAYYSVNTDSIQ